MPETVVIKPGDCLRDLAAARGLRWSDIWNAGENSALRDLRRHPEILLPGDRVVVPDRVEKYEQVSTENRHAFRRAGVPLWLRLRLLDSGEPRTNLPYLLRISGEVRNGRTDGDGQMEERIPVGAKEAVLRLGGEGAAEDYVLRIGWLDPVDTVSGAQARLLNLGYAAGEVDGLRGPVTEGALKEFQDDNDLEVTGRIDEPTKSMLVELHGC